MGHAGEAIGDSTPLTHKAEEARSMLLQETMLEEHQEAALPQWMKTAKQEVAFPQQMKRKQGCKALSPYS